MSEPSDDDNELLRLSHLPAPETVASLREELAAARTELAAARAELATARLEAAQQGAVQQKLDALLRDVREASEDAGGQAFSRLALERAEHLLRLAEIVEVRLWGQSWYGGQSGKRYSVTLTIRGDGEVHGATLREALDDATRRQ